MADNTRTPEPDRQLEDRLRGYGASIDYPAFTDATADIRARLSQSGGEPARTPSPPVMTGAWDDDPIQQSHLDNVTAFPDGRSTGGVRQVLTIAAASFAILIVAAALMVIIPNIAGDGEPSTGVLGPETTGYRYAGAIGGSVIPNQPISVAVGDDGTIYAPDPATRSLHLFDLDGSHIDSWTAEDAEIGAFILPWDVAVQDERVYVVDQRQSAVYILDLDGETLGTFTVGEAGEPGNLLPGIDVDPQGNIHVVRANEGVISIYTNEGEHARDIVVSTDPQSGGGRPADVAVAGDGTVYVTTFAGDVLRVFAPDGAPLADWTDIDVPSQFPGRQVAMAVSVGPDGDIYVNSESGVARLNQSGEMVDSVMVEVPMPAMRVAPTGSVGVNADGVIHLPVPDGQRIVGLAPGGAVALEIADERSGQFAFPAGVHVGEDSLFVSDSLGKQVVEVTRDGTVLSNVPWKTGQFVPPRPGPTGDVVISGEHLFVLDGPDHTVIKLTLDGEQVLEFTGALVGDDPWSRPDSIHTDSRENLYLLDSRASAIYVYNTDGEFQRVFEPSGAAAGLSGPMAMTIVDDIIYVAYSGGSEPGIWALDLDGNPVDRLVEYALDADGNLDHFVGSIAVAHTGDIFTIDPFSRQVRWYGPDGTFRDEWPVEAGYHEAQTFMYLAIDDTGTLYVSDGETRQVLVYEPVR